jgi:predicted branched-subunit amino acid permease
MVIGILFSGILTGLLATIAALSFGMPLWVAIIVYPIVGTAGAVGFIGMTLAREKSDEAEVSTKFATDYR